MELGIRKGDRVGLLLENSTEYVISYYAVLKAGGIAVSLNTESLERDYAYVLNDCGIFLLVTSKILADGVKTIANKMKLIRHLVIWSDNEDFAISSKMVKLSFLPGELHHFASENYEVGIQPQDVATIVYTSGSTGKSRGAVLTHRNIESNTCSIVEYLHLTSNDRIMVILPFYYIYGKSLLNTHFYVGGSVVIDNRFLYPNLILKTMQEQNVTGFSGVPSTFGILFNRSRVRKLRFEHLRYITQAGGAMAPAMQKEVAQVFAPAKLYIMYGATEASARLSYLDPEDLPRKWGSIGKPIPNVKLFVADKNGNPLEAGQEGELVARGENIMQEYWNHPEETINVLKNGLYFTGDIGIMDEDGFLFVVGRKRDMIKAGGHRVSAKEIEEVIHEYPGVMETAVIGIEDETLGEAIKAFIVLDTGSSAENLDEKIRDFLKARLAHYKIPKYIVFCHSLPKNKSGKILKMKLK